MRFRKSQDEAMDAYLDSVGLWRKPTAKDGSCLFRAVAEQLFQTQVFHLQVRQACVQYLDEHQREFSPFIDGPYDQYLQQLQDPTVWAGQVEISALSRLYRRDFIIYQTVGKLPVNATQNGFKDEIVLCFTDGNHYDSVFPKTFGQSIALCQSIVYETLYRGVFKLDKELDEAVRFIREQSKSRRYRKDLSPTWRLDRPDFCPEGDHIQNPIPHHDVIALNHKNRFHDEHSRPLEGKSSPPVPFRIAKALDPEIYRNVELDIWMEAKKEQHQRDLEQSQDTAFTPGDKCQVSLGGGEEEKLYHAHIQEIVSQDKGPVVVFIEELGKKLDVPLSSLRPIAQYSTSPPSESYSRKKNKRGKGVAILVGQRQGYMSPPPGDGIARGRGWNGPRSSSPNYPGNSVHKSRQLPDTSGRPVRPKWHPESYYMRPNFRHGSQPTFWKAQTPGLWRARFPSNTTYMCNRVEEGLIMESPPPADLPPEVGAQPTPEDPRLVSGMEQLCVSGSQTVELDKKGAVIHVPSGTTAAHPVLMQPQQPYSCPPPMSQIQQPVPQPPQMNGQVLMPVYPCIPVSYAEITGGQVNINCGISQDPNGNDLPLSDLVTIRFFYNLGQNYYRWYTYMVNYNQMSNGRIEPTNPLGNNTKDPQKTVPFRSHAIHTVPSNGSYPCYSVPQDKFYVKHSIPMSSPHPSYPPSTSISNKIHHSPSVPISTANSNHSISTDQSYNISTDRSQNANNSDECTSNNSENVDKKSVDSCTHSDSGCECESNSVEDSANENVSNVSIQSDCSDGGKEENDSNESMDTPDKIVTDQSEPYNSDDFPNSKSRPRKYYTWGPYKLLKPIKDIPPRFQQLLAESYAEKARCEGMPIVYQCEPNLSYSQYCYNTNPYNSAPWEHANKVGSQLNPSAPDFTPRYSEENNGEGMASCNPAGTRDSNPSGHSSLTSPHHSMPTLSFPPPLVHSTYTGEGSQMFCPGHIALAPPFQPAPSSFAPSESAVKTCFYHSMPPSSTGYVNSCPGPSTAAPCTSNSTGIVYYTQQTYPPQPMMQPGYNCAVSYPAQPAPTQQAHCIPQYTVYGPPQ